MVPLFVVRFGWTPALPRLRARLLSLDALHSAAQTLRTAPPLTLREGVLASLLEVDCVVPGPLVCPVAVLTRHGGCGP